mmetsp:Transcript_4994/g.5888  ORF Transcript_4994/g.5888 Transcript_4994/m.5888 type:complete len:129 (+) Transcript_4994:556-942(+)
MAPEVADFRLKTKFDMYKADVYSVGVTLHLLLRGELPAQADEGCTTLDSRDLAEADSCSDAESDCEEKWLSDYDGVMELIEWMTSPFSEERPSMQEVMQHPWFTDATQEISAEEVYMEMTLRKRYINS